MRALRDLAFDKYIDVEILLVGSIGAFVGVGIALPIESIWRRFVFLLTATLVILYCNNRLRQLRLIIIKCDRELPENIRLDVANPKFLSSLRETETLAFVCYLILAGLLAVTWWRVSA